MTHVGLVFGGQSPEFEVAIVSARNVARALRAEGFELTLIGIDIAGRWHLGDHAFDLVCAPDGHKQTTSEGLAPIDGVAALVQHQLDVVFPMIHGVSGEDGSIQGLCEVLGIAYVGGDPLNMSLTWDKMATRWCLDQQGVPQLPAQFFYRDSFREDSDWAVLLKGLHFPLFVKPSRTGSSIGISKVNDLDELLKGLQLAFRYDHRVMVEQGIEAMEVEVAGLGALDPIISTAGQIIPGGDFYDFEEKYLKNNTRFCVPAPLSELQLGVLEQLAKRTWQILNCFGMARLDFFVTDNHIYLNEVNTIPGFTEISMYPKLLRATGLSDGQVVRRLVDLALRREELLPRERHFHSHQVWYKAGNHD